MKVKYFDWDNENINTDESNRYEGKWINVEIIKYINKIAFVWWLNLGIVKIY